MDPEPLWLLLLAGYSLTVLIEAPVLAIGLSAQHTLVTRLFAGFWLTACSYPLVILVLPAFIDPLRQRFAYLAVAETLAPVIECLLFWMAFGASGVDARLSRWRDTLVITLANLLSFAAGEGLSGLR
jgi:hypothetical protein